MAFARLSPSAQPTKVDALPLPAPDVARWSPNRKEAVVAAVRKGVLSIEEACRRYALSPAELSHWLQRYAAYGRAGLSATFARMEERGDSG